MSLSLNLDIRSLPWPDSSISLFVEGNPTPTCATIPSTFKENNWHRYSAGYLEAAKQLVDHIEAQRMMGEILVYPIIFLFRHYTELRLKELILSISRLNEQHPPDLRHNHKLRELWDICRPMIEQLDPHPEPADISNVERLIFELHDHDPSSTEARYPDKPNSLSGKQTIDLVHLKSGMEKLAAFLEASSMMVSVYLDS